MRTKVVFSRKKFEIRKEKLLEKVKNNPGIKLTVGQILILFPDFTANQLKYFRTRTQKQKRKKRQKS